MCIRDRPKGQRFVGRLLLVHGAARGFADQPDQERRNKDTDDADDQEGIAPADVGLRPGAEGGADEHAERTVQREEADRQRTAIGRVIIGDHRQRRGGAPRLARADACLLYTSRCV